MYVCVVHESGAFVCIPAHLYVFVCICVHFDAAIIGARGIQIGKLRRRELEYEFMQIYANECILKWMH